MDNQTITIGLAALFIAVAIGSGGSMVWLGRQFTSLRRDVDAKLDAWREARDGREDELKKKIDDVDARLRDHALSIEQRFISKDTANLVFKRLEDTVAQVARDVQGLVRQISALTGRRDLGQGDAP